MEHAFKADLSKIRKDRVIERAYLFTSTEPIELLGVLDFTTNPQIFTPMPHDDSFLAGARKSLSNGANNDTQS